MNPIQQALQFYADPSDYKAPFTGGMGKLWHDCGETAREALRSLQKEVEGVELPPLLPSDHPEPHTLVWSKVEIEAIQAYARTAIAAALGRERVPHGWKLVPVEPTPEMRKAAADAWLDCDSKLLLNKAGAAVRAATAASKEPK